MLKIELIDESISKYHATYIYLEHEIDNIYWVYLKGINEYNFSGNNLEINCKINQKILFQLILKNETHKLYKDNLVLKGEIEYLYDYYEYNQELVDIFFSWSQDKNLLFDEKKYTKLYNHATFLYSGITKIIPCDKLIKIEGKEILNHYHFFNILAEKLLGKRKYLASNLDALYSSLKEADFYKEENEQVINIFDFKILENTIDNFRKGYFREIISILKEFGFKIIDNK